MVRKAQGSYRPMKRKFQDFFQELSRVEIIGKFQDTNLPSIVHFIS